MIMENRISKQQLQRMYGVNRFTIESWVKTKGLPLITITSHSKYIVPTPYYLDTFVETVV
jgi:hypothetical protein